jgi:hypothetical protein
VEKPNAIDQAQQAIIRAQDALARCRAALERAKAIMIRSRADYERLRAGPEESMVRAEVMATVSSWRKAARATEADQCPSADENPVPRA